MCIRMYGCFAPKNNICVAQQQYDRQLPAKDKPCVSTNIASVQPRLAYFLVGLEHYNRKCLKQKHPFNQVVPCMPC